MVNFASDSTSTDCDEDYSKSIPSSSSGVSVSIMEGDSKAADHSEAGTKAVIKQGRMSVDQPSRLLVCQDSQQGHEAGQKPRQCQEDEKRDLAAYQFFFAEESAKKRLLTLGGSQSTEYGRSQDQKG